MITKGDLKIEAARLAMDAVNVSIERGTKIEFTPLAEEIYVFLAKDLRLKDVEDPKDMMSQLASMMGRVNCPNVTPKEAQDGSDTKELVTGEEA